MPGLSSLSARDFYLHSGKVKKFVVANMKRLVMNEAYVNDVYIPLFNTYETAYLDWENPETRTPLITQAKDAAREAFEPVERKMEGFLKMMPGIRKEELENLNINPNTGGGGKTKEPGKEKTLIEADTSVAMRVLLNIFNEKTKKRGKPDWAKYARVAVGIVGASPEDEYSRQYYLKDFVIDAELLPFRAQVTNGKLLLEFRAHQSGLKLLVAGCFVTSAGRRGPWTKIGVITIP
jgi:hypothetical protein